jgi:hypothetical protein
MKFLTVLLILLTTNAHADSYLFGRSADEAFGSALVTNSARYRAEGLSAIRANWRPLSTTFGANAPTPLRILIKADSIATPLTQSYVTTLSVEKSKLMGLYHLSNQDYNRLAAIAFGILGRETKFGMSRKYQFKEAYQDEVSAMKALKCAILDCEVGRNSRGLTQIKLIPASIKHAYWFSLNKPGTERPLESEDLDFGFSG